MSTVDNSTLGGRYRLIRPLGRGGMANVYEAVDEHSAARVAVKVLRAVGGPAQIARFQREVEALARLSHPGIVAVSDFGADGDAYYYVMECVTGWSLATVLAQLRAEVGDFAGVAQVLDTLRRSQDLPPAQADSSAETAAPAAGAPAARGSSAIEPFAAQPRWSAAPPAIRTRTYVHEMCRLARDAALALAHAHARGVVHRDVKPENLLLDQEGRLRVTDFGLATVAGEQSVTVAGELLGTPRYMSPEQIAANRVPIDARTDVYSLGTTLYEMLALVPPHERPTREGLLQAIAVKEPAPLRSLNPGVDRELAAVVQRAMEKDADRRYASMADFAADLERCLAGRRVAARPVGRLRRSWRRLGRGARVGVLVAAAVVVAGSLWAAVRLGTRPPAGVSAAQRAVRLAEAESASRAGDWEAALARFAQALPAEPRWLVTLRMQYALARVPPVRMRMPYVGPGARAAFSADGRLLVACHRPQAALLVDTEQPSGRPIEISHRADDVLQSLSITPDSERIVSVGWHEAACWDASGRRLGVLTAPSETRIRAATTDDRGTWLLVMLDPVGRGARTLQVARVEAASPAAAPLLEVEGALDGALSPAGDLAAAITGEGELLVAALRAEPGWKAASPPMTGGQLRRVWCPVGGISVIALDARGRWHAGRFAGERGEDLIWLGAYDSPATWSPGDAQLAALAACGPERLVTAVPLRAGAGRPGFALQLHQASDFAPVGAEFTADAALVCDAAATAVVLKDEGIELRTAERGECVRVFAIPPGTHDATARDAGQSPAGVPALAAGLPAIWPGVTVIGPADGLSVDARATRIMLAVAATAEQPGVVRVWDTATGLLLASGSPSDQALLWARLDPSGTRLLCAYEDGRLLERDLDAVAAAVTPAAASDRTAPDGALTACALVDGIDPQVWPDAHGVGGTSDGTIRLLYGDPSKPSVEVHARLGNIRAVAQHESMVAAVDEHDRCALLDLTRVEALRAGDAAPPPADALLLFDLSHTRADELASGGPSGLALTHTEYAHRWLLAVVRGSAASVWALEGPTFSQAGSGAHLLGGSLPLVCPPAGPRAASARFATSAGEQLDLVVTTDQGLDWRVAVLAPRPPADVQRSASEAWRLHLTAVLGRRLHAEGGRTQNVSDEDWTAAQAWLKAPGQ